MIHARNIVHETLEGETIVIHLETGNYYSLTGSGAEIWTLLEGGSSVSQICAELARRHTIEAGEIEDEVEGFLSDLEREDLVEDGGASSSPTRPDPSASTRNGRPAEPVQTNGGWAAPKLERYDDMRDFLLVDPIHEVDQTGWPSRQAAQ